MTKNLLKAFSLMLMLLMSVSMWATMSGSSTELMPGQGNPFTNGYDYEFSTSGTDVTITVTSKEGYVGLVAYLWDYTSGFAETQMTVSGQTASITLHGKTAGSTIDFAVKFAYAGGMSVTKRFNYVVEAGGGSDPGPGPEPEPDPNAITAGGHTISLNPTYNSITNEYTLLITSSDNISGLGGSFWNVNGVGTDMRNNMTKVDDHTLRFTVTSTAAPNIYTPLYVLMPGEVNFGSVTLNWVDVAPISSEYCNYTNSDLTKGGKAITLTWETDGNGDVVITMNNGAGATSCSFRNGGFEGGIDAFVVSTDNFVTTTPASDYFTFEKVYSGNVARLVKIADLPEGAKIKHVGTGHALAWKLNGGDQYSFPDFVYTYGGICTQLDAPANVAVAADGTITFDATPNAETYEAFVYFNSTLKYQQTVTSGDVLNYSAIKTGTYQVVVVAKAAGLSDSEESAAADWYIEAAPIVLGNSEYCGVELGENAGNKALFMWETLDNGNVEITITELDGSVSAVPDHVTSFRNNGVNIANLRIGSSAASEYFNSSRSGNVQTLSLKDPANAPDFGEKFAYNGVVEYKVYANQNAYPTIAFNYTYGTKCPNLIVAAKTNDVAMGSATVANAAGTEIQADDEVTFRATPASADYAFVNWTKGGVEVSTDAEYHTTITESITLTANFDYRRDVYCHEAITSIQGKKLYMTLGATGNPGEYMIRFEGSEEVTLTGINNANYQINHVSTAWKTGNDVPFTVANGGWTFDAAGFGAATCIFNEQGDGTHTWKDFYVWTHAIFFSSAIGEQGYNQFPDRYHIDWSNICSDDEAPILAAPTADALNTTDIRLTMSATDNWGGTITYTISREGADDVVVYGVSGETVTKDIEDLASDATYTFSIVAKDAANNTCVAKNCSATLSAAGDVTAPTGVTVSAKPMTDTSVELTLFANDDYDGDIIYNITYEGGSTSTSATRGAETKYVVTGLTVSTAYTFSVVAADAAGNEATAVEANATTFSGNLAYHKTAHAGYDDANAKLVTDGDLHNRWGSNGANHPDEDWLSVNLENVYDIANVRISWENARPANYVLETSYDGENWTVVKTMSTLPVAGATTFEVYELTAAQGRYIRVRTTSRSGGYDNLNWGISIWEFQAYGTPAVDAVAPVVTAFTGNGVSNSAIQLHAQATDNFCGELTYIFYDNADAEIARVENVAYGEEATYNVTGLTEGSHTFGVKAFDGVNYSAKESVTAETVTDTQAPEGLVVNITNVTPYAISLEMSATDDKGGDITYAITWNGGSHEVVAASGATANYTIEGLTYATNYTIAVVARDGAENATTPNVQSQRTLRADFPLVGAPTPTYSADYVHPIYSATYGKTNTNWEVNSWGNNGSQENGALGGKKLFFNTSGYIGITNFTETVVAPTDHLYMDIWINDDATIKVTPIIRNAEMGNNPEYGVTVSLVGGQWNKVDLMMNEGALQNYVDQSRNSVYQVKLEQASNLTIWIDNIFIYAPATIRADLTEGKIGTICLPYALNAGDYEGATFYSITHKELKDGQLYKIFFEEEKNLVAGQPYVFEAEGETITGIYSGEAVATAGAYNGLVGTFTEISPLESDGENIYVISNNKVRKVAATGEQTGAGVSLGAKRAYINMEDVPGDAPAPAPGRKRISLGTNETNVATDLEAISGSDNIEKLMIDGVIYIRRGEKLYDVTGRLVK